VSRCCTHTFSTLEVSRETYGEVERLLKAAGYDHVFVDGAIDMMGIALVQPAAPRQIVHARGIPCGAGKRWGSAVLTSNADPYVTCRHPACAKRRAAAEAST
jgi:hypothetical protein